MTAPNYFIIGAPKCGTTAISEYLGLHKDAFMCVPKEPHYFAFDLPNYRVETTWEDYLGLFADSGGKKAVGEASVFYLYSREAVPAIRRQLPQSKLIVMLRNPIVVAEAMHLQARWTGDEPVADFEAAWRLGDQRKRGLDLPPHSKDIKTLLYDELAKLGTQLQRVLDAFPREQVRWWFFDDFSADPARVYNEILDFLALERDGRADFPVVNQRKRARSQALALFLHKPPPILHRTSQWLKRRLGIREWRFLDTLDQMNMAKPKEASLSKAFQAELRDHYENEIRLLAEITGRDLSHWLKEPG